VRKQSMIPTARIRAGISKMMMVAMIKMVVT
jgi:hypothetical protein